MAYPFWLFFSFRGRIGRAAFWAGCGVILCFALLLDLLVDVEEGTAAAPIVFSVFQIGAAAMLLAGLAALAAKRFHDRGKTAWLVLLAGLLFAASDGLASLAGGSLPGAIRGILTQAGTPSTFLAEALLAVLLDIAAVAWLVIDLGILPASPEASRYGPPSGPRDEWADCLG